MKYSSKRMHKNIRKSNLIKLYFKQGLNQKDIAKMYNVSQQTICNYLQSFNIKINHGRRYINCGIKTKKLWNDKDYRIHMSKVHKGQKAWNKGIPLNKQLDKNMNKLRKEKISLTLKRKYKNGERKSAQLGKPISLSHRLAIKNYMTGRFFGDKHPNWNGGSSMKPYTLKFKHVRKLILLLDNYTCQKCFTNENLSVHHIDYDKFNDDEINLITLCKPCNGNVNANRDYWRGYFNEKIDSELYR